jgi:hypothetical protein
MYAKSGARTSLGAGTRKKKQLEKAGWKIGSPDEFLGLSQDESSSALLRMEAAKSDVSIDLLVRVGVGCEAAGSAAR